MIVLKTTVVCALFSFICVIPPLLHAVDFAPLLNNPLIETLDREVASHYLTKHDFLRCFQNGQFSNMTHAAAVFAENHFIYSRSFIDYLNIVVNKIDNETIAEPILENIAEESGNYSDEDLAEMQQTGIAPEWFAGLPHKLLFHRFVRSLGIDPLTVNASAPHNHAGNTFTEYMLDTYARANPCEALSVIGFAIEETVSTLYEYIWDGLKNFTQLTPQEYVFFPLHILLDDGHADLLKLGFLHYLEREPDSCAHTPQLIKDALDRRSLMFDELRQQIEQEQGYKCPLPYLTTTTTTTTIPAKKHSNDADINCDMGEGESDVIDIEGESDTEKNKEGKMEVPQLSVLGIQTNESVDRNFSSTEEENIVTADMAVKDAQREASRMMEEGGFDADGGRLEWDLVQKMAISSRILAEQGHGTTLSGQITCMDAEATSIAGEVLFWSTAYGKPLEVITEDDFVLVDKDLNVVASSSSSPNGNFPSRAVRFHAHVYRQRPDIACIIHTHPPKTSALAMIGKPLHIAHMDTMAFYEDVQYLSEWPGIPFGDEEGEIISGLLGDKYWSALLAHHGLLVGGRSIEEATYRAFFFERAAALQIDAMAANGGDLSAFPATDPELSRKARDWRISEGPVKAHFNGWAQVAFQKGHWDCVSGLEIE